MMPDWIGDPMAGVGPEATQVFGRNAHTAVIRRRRAHADTRRLSNRVNAQTLSPIRPRCPFLNLMLDGIFR
jgi:hypothetical protein